MAKFLIWYQLQLKAWCKTRLCWFQLLVLSALLLVIMSISFPDKNNMKAGIFCENAEFLQLVEKRLTEKKSAFSFIEYPDEKKMKEDVLSGKLECAFSINKDIIQKLAEGETKQLIHYYCTPLTTKGKVMQESIYAVVYEDIVKNDLLQRMKDFYSPYEDLQAIEQELMEGYQRYLDEGNVYNMQVEYLEIKPKKQQESKTFLVHGIVGFILFMTMVMGGMSKNTSGSKKVELALDFYNRRFFEASYYLAIVTPLAILGMVFNLISKEAVWWMEIPAMLLLVGTGIFWMMIYQKIISSETTMIGSVFVLVAILFILCPVFLDISRYIPAVKYLRMLFPPGIYLSVLG